MKSLIQDLDDLNNEQIDALVSKLTKLKTARNKKAEQETKSAFDMLTKEQKTIIKSIDKIIKVSDLMETASNYDDDNVNGFIEHTASIVNDFGYDTENDILDSQGIVKDVKREIKEKNKELREAFGDLEVFKKQTTKATEAKKLLEKLKKTIKK
jgi:hypothetical protein